jgi:energy-coupling factor transport system permease protein
VHRFLPLLNEEWELIQLAHRLRGVGSTYGLRGKWERFRRYTIPLIAGAIRKADRVAMAMESRGLSERERTFRKTIRLSMRDLLYVVGWILFLYSSSAFIYTFGDITFWKGQL